jgi:hypothetical protein
VFEDSQSSATARWRGAGKHGEGRGSHSMYLEVGAMGRGSMGWEGDRGGEVEDEP